MRAAFFNPDRAVEYLLNASPWIAEDPKFEQSLTAHRAFPKTCNESNHKQEAAPQEGHVQLAHPPQRLHPRPPETHQPQPPAMKATKPSTCLKQPPRPAALAEELEAPAEDALEEQAVLTLQA